MPDFESDPRAEQFQQVASGVYRRLDLESVWSAFEYVIDHELTHKNPTIMLMFVRIAEVYPEVLRLFESRRATADGNLAKAIDVVRHPPQEIAQAAYLPDRVVSPGELDLCWAEFLVTGKTSSIEKVIAVLDQSDHSRRELAGMLANKPDSLNLSETDRAELLQFGIAFGRDSSEQNWELVSPGDLDILLGMALKSGSETAQNVLRSLTEETRLVIATKSAALWSLQSNATQHGLIRLLCEEAAKLPGGFGRQLLIQQ